MDISDYSRLIGNCPAPTPEQFDAFAAHVAVAHSWYKHLDLFAPAEFVVFLDPNAGGGFDQSQPRIHHTWATREEYRSKFGCLAYMYRTSSEDSFHTDYAHNARIALNENSELRFVDERRTAVLELPAALQTRCGFRLYPFACDNDVFFWRYEKALAEIAAGRLQHPCADLLSAYYQAMRAFRNSAAVKAVIDKDTNSTFYWFIYLSSLTAAEGENPEIDLSDTEREYVRYNSMRTDAWRALEEHEAGKIHTALANLREFIESAHPGRLANARRRAFESAAVTPAVGLRKHFEQTFEIVAGAVDSGNAHKADSSLKAMPRPDLGFHAWRDDRDKMCMQLVYGVPCESRYDLSESAARSILVNSKLAFATWRTMLDARGPRITRKGKNETCRESLVWRLGSFEVRLELWEGLTSVALVGPEAPEFFPNSPVFGEFLQAYDFAAEARSRANHETRLRAAFVILKNYDAMTRHYGETMIEAVVTRMRNKLSRTATGAKILRWSRDEILILDDRRSRREFIELVSRYANEFGYPQTSELLRPGPGRPPDASSSVIVVQGALSAYPDLTDLLAVAPKYIAAERDVRGGRVVVLGP